MSSSIRPRVLVQTGGSGNWGEQGDASFYTIDTLPEPLRQLSETSLPEAPLRRDIDIGPGGLAFVIENILTPAEADALAACSEAIFDFNGNSRFAPGIQTPPGMRQNMAAHWFPTPVEEAERALFGPMYARFKHLLPHTLGGRPLYGHLNQKLAVFKYEGGDQFLPHTDGIFPGSGASRDGNGVETWSGVQSGLSMLLYLNDAAGPEKPSLIGGETRLYRMGTRPEEDKFVDVTPKKGSALFFRHGGDGDSVLHAGLPVTQGTKSMVKMNVLYGVRTGTTRLH